MDNVATASLNNLRIPEANFVPSSEQSITVSLSDLRQIITQAVQEAIQPLQDEVELLRATVASQEEKIAALTSTQDTQADNQLIQLRLINQLRETARKEPTADQVDKIKILRALLAAHGGKMLMRDARRIMKMDSGNFSRLVAAAPEYVDIKKSKLNKRLTLLMLKSDLNAVNSIQH